MSISGKLTIKPLIFETKIQVYSKTGEATHIFESFEIFFPISPLQSTKITEVIYNVGLHQVQVNKINLQNLRNLQNL